jgi:hypothetical protein
LLVSTKVMWGRSIRNSLPSSKPLF